MISKDEGCSSAKAIVDSLNAEDKFGQRRQVPNFLSAQARRSQVDSDRGNNLAPPTTTLHRFAYDAARPFVTTVNIKVGLATWRFPCQVNLLSTCHSERSASALGQSFG
jgi:hypothetical protein